LLPFMLVDLSKNEFLEKEANYLVLQHLFALVVLKDLREIDKVEIIIRLEDVLIIRKAD
jgi:hypothetical protein